MNNIPTAEGYIKKHPYVNSFLSSAQGYDVLVTFMIEFAKLHVQAALKEASEKYAMKFKDNIEELHMNDDFMEVDRNSILNAYPLENIK